MSSISHQVRQWLLAHPAEARFTAEKLINASALARKIKQDLQIQSSDTISTKAITLAVNRYSKIEVTTSRIDMAAYVGEISVQSGVSLIAIPHADLDVDGFAKAITILHKTREFTLYARGIWHTTLIASKGIVEELKNHFRYEILTHDLVALTIKLKPGHKDVSGFHVSLLQKLALQNINLQEVISSHTELTIIVTKADSHTVIDCLI